ncbi:BQ5605_C013g07166 [Microbotryum silenes-dioicae]|uniref:BQ5605_C013g07166 protein n=1 Tax=Microbotryum silenes-dioicae TaxID=796604 RepID=A0A2X0MKH0_9BASI|nr:BQ5605_C013g07166 [Microbotryum silenes-dioicae]
MCWERGRIVITWGKVEGFMVTSFVEWPQSQTQRIQGEAATVPRCVYAVLIRRIVHDDVRVGLVGFIGQAMIPTIVKGK